MARFTLAGGVCATFNSFEFSFAGESSAMYGLMIYDLGDAKNERVNFGGQASIIEAQTIGRIQPLHFGVNYHTKPLEFKLVFGSERPMNRFELENIALWLTGYDDYQWLAIRQPDLYHVEYRCLVTQLTPVHVDWLPVAFEASVRCDCPYAYSRPFETRCYISGEKQLLFRNISSVREYLKPTLYFAPGAGVTALHIVNHGDNGREFLLEGLSTDTIVEIDNKNCILRETKDGAATYAGRDLYGGLKTGFFRLAQGDNPLVITGNGQLTITGRFLHNVGA